MRFPVWIAAIHTAVVLHIGKLNIISISIKQEGHKTVRLTSVELSPSEVGFLRLCSIVSWKNDPEPKQ
jgi:hypothetical protein